MTKDEKFLIFLLAKAQDRNTKAVLLQGYIAQFGPLSDEAGNKVRELLKQEGNTDA
jgi:hypothetical protein